MAHGAGRFRHSYGERPSSLTQTRDDRIANVTLQFQDRGYENLVREGVLAARTGRLALARRLLIQATRIRPTDAVPWVWLSETTQDPEERKNFLERAVAADPSNGTARRGLAILSGVLNQEELLEEGEGVAARQPVEADVAGAQVFSCPKCGGHQAFDLDHQGLRCTYCGYMQPAGTAALPAAADQPVDLILPTEKGHRWAEADHQLACERCGSVTVLGAGQKTSQCAYCGSNQFLETAEAADLLEPQTIGLMEIDAVKAAEAIRTWLGRGLYAPDDLPKRAKIQSLRPAYYPFWTFNGTLEARWNCEIRVGTGDTAYWVPRHGTEYVMFSDVLVPGLTKLAPAKLKGILPFELKRTTAYKTAYLAGWPALSYDRSMADASLLAREQVVQDLRRTVGRRIEPGEEKRNLQVGGGKWSGLSFKHVLLPLWIGTYSYQDTVYDFLVNGQTGKVTGDKPRDDFKVKLTWVAAGTTAAVLALLAIVFLLLYR